MTVESEIAQLTDQQALSILSSLNGELVESDAPESSAEQAELLESFLGAEGTPVALEGADNTDAAAAGAAARELLVLMAGIEEFRPSLEEWVHNPPSQEQAALPLLLLAPIVFTGCIVLLQVVGHTRFHRSADGKWEWAYEPARKAPIDEVIKGMGRSLLRVTDAAQPPTQ
jgi:hypothetical protein